MLGLPDWAVIVILLALELIPILGFAGNLISSLATEILWVWALIVTILGTQNTLSIIFYILFLINLIRYSFTFFFFCSAKELNKKLTISFLALILGVLLIIIGVSLHIVSSRNAPDLNNSISSYIVSSEFSYKTNNYSNYNETDTSAIVYITEYGEKYHRSSCQYLSKSKIQTTVKKALQSGYEPCNICNPPKQ